MLIPPTYRLVEWTGAGQWEYYGDYTTAVEKPIYLRDPPAGQVVQLSEGCSVHEYVTAAGHKNIGTWIDNAAQQVGR